MPYKLIVPVAGFNLYLLILLLLFQYFKVVSSEQSMATIKDDSIEWSIEIICCFSLRIYLLRTREREDNEK